MRYSIAAVILASLPAAAAPPTLVVVPAKYAAGDVLTVRSDVVAKWNIRGGGPHLMGPDGKSVTFYVPAGSVQIFAAATDAPNLADVASVTVGEGAPVPPGPGPGPGPGPQPPPEPTGPLAAKLKAAYLADPAPAAAKDEARKGLVALYEEAAKMLADPAAAPATAGELRERVAAASRAMTDGKLLGVREAVATDLAATFGTNPAAPLTAEKRAEGAKLFLRLAAILAAF